ncbi:MAG: hypothetical protein ACYSWR_07265, partial [Planctomycetota bacterium]
ANPSAPAVIVAKLNVMKALCSGLDSRRGPVYLLHLESLADGLKRNMVLRSRSGKVKEKRR